MTKEIDAKLVVLHLDHTHEAGGAEFALKRLLAAKTQWEAYLLLPRDQTTGLGTYSSISTRDVIVRKLGPKQRPGASDGGISPIKIGFFLGSILVQAVCVRFSREFKRSSVVYANTSRAALYGALACSLSRKVLVVHLRDLVSEESLGKFGLLAFRLVVLRRADGLIANSAATLRSALSLPTSSTPVSEVIPSPFGCTPTSKSIPSEVVAGQSVSIGMVARIDPWKGQSLLVQAFAREFRGKSVELHLAGAPAFGQEEYLQSLKAECRALGIHDQVTFWGHIDDVAGFIGQMDICVQSSLRPEPLGQNVLQYLSHGKATVASGEGGPTEWVADGENGLLFKPRNFVSLAEKLKILVEDDGLRNRLSTAAAGTPGLLTDSEIAFDIANFLAKVCAKPKKPEWTHIS